MTAPPDSLARENAQVLNLVQALLGAISPNMRAIAIDCHPDHHVHFHVVLAREDADDREEIDDVVFVFASLQSAPVDVQTHVVISDGPLPPVPGRLVYLRKEAAAGGLGDGAA